MYSHIGNRQYIQVATYVCTLIKRKSALFHSQIHVYIQTNFINICTVQVLASIGNLCQQPTCATRHSAGVLRFLPTKRVPAYVGIPANSARPSPRACRLSEVLLYYRKV